MCVCVCQVNTERLVTEVAVNASHVCALCFELCCLRDRLNKSVAPTQKLREEAGGLKKV